MSTLIDEPIYLRERNNRYSKVTRARWWVFGRKTSSAVWFSSFSSSSFPLIVLVPYPCLVSCINFEQDTVCNKFWSSFFFVCSNRLQRCPGNEEQNEGAKSSPTSLEGKRSTTPFLKSAEKRLGTSQFNPWSNYGDGIHRWAAFLLRCARNQLHIAQAISASFRAIRFPKIALSSPLFSVFYLLPCSPGRSM